MSKQISIPIERADHFLAHDLDDVVPMSAWGEVSYFYNPGRQLKRGTYFATIKRKDGKNDRASKIDRPGFWRLNIGVSKPVYRGLFGDHPARPPKGGVVEGPWDFLASDLIMPHPVYAWMGWIAVLCPSETTWQRCIPLIHDAHAKAKESFRHRLSHL